jgi:hypothetical protein
MVATAETWYGATLVESYPVPELTGIDDVAALARAVQQLQNMVREFRERDIAADDVYQQALYQIGYKKGTATIDDDYLLGATTYAVDVDATAAAVTVTLPPNPTDCETHAIFKNDASANNVEIDGNGKDINGTGSITFNTQYEGRILIYMGGTGEWRAGTI